MTDLTCQIRNAPIPTNEIDRIALLNVTRTLIQKLETPEERILRMCYHHTAIFSTTRTLIDLEIFKVLSSSTSPQTATELAIAVNAAPELVSRLLKHISTETFIEEVGPDTYIANSVTRCLASPGGQGTVLDSFQLVKIWDALPGYLKENGYQNPQNKDTTAWKHAYQTPLHYFESITQPGNEKRLAAFQQHMSFKSVGLKWFEVGELTNSVFKDLEANDGEERTLVVDVGGNSGYDLLALRAAHPKTPGKFILQDLQTLISSLSQETMEELAKASITPMPHDFFTPQPVLGARVYYSKMCLHDWPNAQCVEILKNLRPAMRKGYSKILLNEIVVPDEKAWWFETAVDGLMMVVHGAQERREKEGRELVESVAGLKVVKFWDVEGAVEKIIEIEAV